MYQTRSALAAYADGAAIKVPEIATRAAVMRVAMREEFESRFMGWRVGRVGYPQSDFGANRAARDLLGSADGHSRRGRFGTR